MEERGDPVTPPRLSEGALPQARPGVQRPAYDRAAARIGVAHFGPGAFHRAHQAWYFDQLLAHDPNWAIAAVSLKTPGVRDALQPQDGLYTLAELDERTSFRVIGAIKQLLVAPETPDLVLERLASPDTRLVTLTVTEKGYCLTPDGDLDLNHPDIVHDLTSPAAPASVIGWLVEGLRRRRLGGERPFDVLSCDNLTDNGLRLRKAVVQFASERDPELARWIEGEARFPRTMVDSITPATDDVLRERTQAETGLYDAWPIQREAFVQWVIEDVLSPGAPDLAAVGATLTTDVRGFEQAKLRLLNGPHSTLAYAGLLRGHQTVGEAMDDVELASLVRTMMVDDIAPTLNVPPGLDVARYANAVLRRFRNPEIRHNLSQIAWDGSQKLPFRVLGTIRDALLRNGSLDRLSLPIAAWMVFVARCARDGVPLVDPLAEQLAAVGRACTGEAAADVARFLAFSTVFPVELAAEPRFRSALEDAYGRLSAN